MAQITAMTDKQFLASKWKPFEVLHTFLPEYNKHLDVILVGIDFEDRTMKVRPLDSDMVENEIQDVHITFLHRGKYKPVFKVEK